MRWIGSLGLHIQYGVSSQNPNVIPHFPTYSPPQGPTEPPLLPTCHGVPSDTVICSYHKTDTSNIHQEISRSFYPQEISTS